MRYYSEGSIVKRFVILTADSKMAFNGFHYFEGKIQPRWNGTFDNALNIMVIAEHCVKDALNDLRLSHPFDVRVIEIENWNVTDA
jgi:hypothetical protein